MSYKLLVDRLLKDESRRLYTTKIVYKLTFQYTTGEIAKLRKDITELYENLEDVIYNGIIERALSEAEYKAAIIPSMISKDKAINFYLGKEYPPSEKEFYRFIYLLLSGLIQGDYIISFDNVPYSLLDDFWESLVNQRLAYTDIGTRDGLDIYSVETLIGFPKIPVRFLKEYVIGFLILSLFTKWIRDDAFKIKKLKIFDVDNLLNEYNLKEDASLVIFHIPRAKKSIHVIPRLKNNILRWYSDYLSDPRLEVIPLVKFLSSFYISSKEYRDSSINLLNKFLYYLLNGYVNGPLLDKLISMKIEYELSKNKGVRRYGVWGAIDFFSRL